MKHYNIYIKTLAILYSHIEKLFVRNAKKEISLAKHRFSLSK